MGENKLGVEGAPGQEVLYLIILGKRIGLPKQFSDKPNQAFSGLEPGSKADVSQMWAFLGQHVLLKERRKLPKIVDVNFTFENL